MTGGYGLLVNNYQRKAAAEEDRREIEEHFAAARVDSLIRQLRPHFIFNSLNTVSALVGDDPARAARIAEELRDLFRWSLDARQEVSLEDEISFLSKYVDVQKARFDERLRISFAVNAGVQRAAVPALILQPLVENAIRHGMTTRAGVEIGVHAERHDDQVRLRVINDGRAIPDMPLIEGVGLSNTRERLRAMYGQKASFDARARAEGGFEVEIRVPLR